MSSLERVRRDGWERAISLSWLRMEASSSVAAFAVSMKSEPSKLMEA